MKKAFNFRSAIVCVLVLIMCLTAFVACDKTKGDQNDLSNLTKAKDYVKQLYINNNEETAADYTVVSKVNISGTVYTVTWTVNITTEGANPEDVRVVPGEDSVTIDVVDMAENDIEYVLTATVTDANGNTATVEFNRKVPKFKVATWAEYAAAEDGTLLIVDGIVTMYSSKTEGKSYNSMYIQDNDGAYYAYSMDVDPVEAGVQVGMKVRLTGTKKNYNGTLELEKVLVKEILDTTIVEVSPIDITELCATLTSAKDVALTNMQGSIVTLSGAIAVDIDEGNKYCYFTIGGVKTYIRPSQSAGYLSNSEITEFINNFKSHIGYNATITGQALVYDKAFYLQPLSTTAVTFGGVADLSPEQQVKFVKDNANALGDVTYSGMSITLPSESSIFTDVKIAWTADSTDYVNIEGGQATFTYDYETAGRKVVLTATYTHATDATVAPLTNEFEVELLVPQEVTVAEFLEKDTSDTHVYIITGFIVADGSSSGTGSFVVADETGAIFSYNKANVAVGDRVKVYGTRGDNYGVAQIATLNVVPAEDGSSYVYPEAKAVDGATIDLSTLSNTTIGDWTGVYTKITGLTLYRSNNYNNAGLLKDGATAGSTNASDYTQVLSLYSASDAISDELLGKPVIVYGYVRGYSQGKYLTIQVAKVEIGYSDAEKLALAKDELTSVTGDGSVAFSDSFTLVTEGAYGTTIAWSIKEADVTALTIDGATATVTKPETDVALTLVATISLAGSEEAAVEKEFPITITATIPTYTVTITPVTGATITVMNGSEEVVSGTTLNKGTELVITVVVDTDHRLGAVKDGETTLTAETDGSYKLTLVAEANITVELKNAYSCLVEGEEIKTFAQLQELIPNPGDSTSEKYYTMGYIKSVDNEKYGNLTLVDGDGNTFIIYGSYSYDGSTRYDSLPTKPVVDDFVVLVGVLTNFNGTYEMKNACLCQLNDQLYAPTLAEQVAQAKTALTLEASYHANFNLPLTGANGTTITWATKTETTVVVINAETGEVTINPVDPSTTITLVATIQKGSASDTKEIDVVILKETPKYTISWTVGENGTLTSAKAGETALTSGDEVEVDTVVTFVVAPQDGYRLASVTIGEGTADTSFAGQTTFDVTVTANTTVAIAFEVIPEVKTNYSHTFAKDDITASGDVTLSGVTWNVASSSTYFGWDTNASRGIQFGSSKAAASEVTLSTSGISDFNKIVVNLSTASSAVAYVEVYVNGVLVGEKTTLTTTATDYTFTLDSVSSGTIEIKLTQPSTSKALYIKSIAVSEE